MKSIRIVCLCLVLALVFLSGLLPAQSKSPLQISELVPENRTGLVDEDGDVADWIELRNTSAREVSLEGWGLTDSKKAPQKWRFPAIVMPPRSYLLVFASGKDRRNPEGPLHSNFRLSVGGEYIALTAPDGSVADAVPGYPTQRRDDAWGRVPPDGRLAPLAYPTPGRANSEQRVGRLSKLVLSASHGMLQAPLDLTVDSEPGVTVRYTTDGTLPNETSPVLTTPWRIEHTTVLRAQGYQSGYAPTPVVTRSYIFPEDRLDDSADGLPPAGYPYRWAETRANYGIDEKILARPDRRAQLIDALNALPSYSLVIDPEELFSDDRGIYAHAGWHGKRAERRCSLELLPFGETEKGFQIDCGVRIRGGASRRPGVEKHGFRLFFRSQYGESKLKYPLFGEEGVRWFDHVDLRCSQNYAWHHGPNPRALYVRDQVNRDAQLEMGHPAPRGNFRHLYINGHYWGLFNTCERPKASFAAAYLGGDKEDYDVVKVKGGYSEGDEDRRYQVFPTDGDFADWEKLNELSLRDLSQNDNYRALIGVRPDGRRDKGRERLLDPVNLVDYMLVVFWAGNLDAPISWFGNNRGGNNWYGIYNRRRNDGFRFIMWDAEHSLLDLYEDRQGPFPEGPTADRNNPMWLYQRCLANEEFRTLLADRIARHMFRGGVLTPEPSIARLHRRTDEVREALFGEAARWGNPRKTWEWALRDAAAEPEGDPAIENYQAWFREVDRLTNEYFPQRTAVVVDQLFSRGLYPDIPEIEHSWGAAGDGDRRALSLSAGEWQIVFTTNGEDPRLFGGGLNPKARVVEGPVPVGRKTRILCRAYDGTEWGPLREFVGSGKSRSSRVGD